ncbi:unnamed protein product [Arabis nemorensis]|uniref:RRM domain-containing protein n=1 Tax=Arabis nemorensis TaxID=586526 RepID=A0A565BMW7_9BRAS|nr:unnamed protein product [Arabis nemorensis]
MASSSMRSVNLLGKRKPEDGLDTRPFFVRKHKELSEEKDTTKEFAEQIKGSVELLETKSDQANLLLSVKETVEELDHQTPHFVEESAVITNTAAVKNTLFIGHLPFQTEISVLISDIVEFFKNVAKLVRVQLVVTRKGQRSRCCGFVEFASSNEAKKALEKNGEYLQDSEVLLELPKINPYPPKYEEDYLGRESPLLEEYHLETEPKMDGLCRQEDLLIEEDETPPDFIEEAKHVGYGFVEFASSNEAKEALQMMNGEYLHECKIFLDVATTAPYPPRPNYEDYIRRESLLIEEDETVEGLDQTPDFVEAVAVRKKTLFIAQLAYKTEISHIINFFKDVGEVVHVRLIVNRKGKHEGYGFVEFASANESKRALEKKNGEYLHDCKIFLDVAATAPYPPRPMYEDYLRQESRLIKEDEAVEGLDEIPHLVEEVALRKKTLFIANLPCKPEISYIIRKFFKHEVVRVRLIVNHRGEHVGCGFVEFASANEAKKVLEKKNGECNRKIFIDVVKTPPYLLRPKYNLAEKLW